MRLLSWLDGLKLDSSRRRAASRARPHRTRLYLEPLEDRSLLSANWVDQGPGIILGLANDPVNGNGNSVEGIPGRPQDGAVQALAVDPTNANIVYAASVNGGIWKTTDATDANPIWMPLTDQSLPAESMQSIAISPVNPKTIFAGTGSTSSFFFDGNNGFGIARSTDAGKHWQVLATDTFAGQRVRSIVPTTLEHGNVILAATLFGSVANGPLVPGGGVYRSTDNGNSFQQISGAAGSGLPPEEVSDLVADPSNPYRFYAAVDAFISNTTGAEGVYRSDDGGMTWSSVSNGLTGLDTSQRILLSVHNSAGKDVLYAAVIGNNGDLQGVFRSADLGADWTPMGVPSPTIFPGLQGYFNGAIAADPRNPNVVFISGDRQDVPPIPNVNGATTYSANVFRGDASLANPWQNVVGNGAQGSSPHPDSRALVFDANGNLLYACDGGVYRLMHPDDPTTRIWVSLDSNLRTAEFHSVAYDPVSHIVIGGTQDNGTPMQSAPGSLTYTDYTSGDGGVVAVDSNQTAHPGTSIRYSSGQFLLLFHRASWDANNHLLSDTPIGLNIVSGPNAGQNFLNVDPNIQFYQPFVLNVIDPTRMLIGTHNIYESFNQGDSLYDLGNTGAVIGGNQFGGFGLGEGTPMVYGGRLNGVANADMFYVASNNSILHRVTAGGTTSTLSAYAGDSIVTMVVDPQNYRHLFVVDQQNRIWATLDEGKTFTELTANLHDLTHDHQGRSIEFYASSESPNQDVLLVGAEGGVFEMKHFDRAGAYWQLLGKDLPHSSVLDLHYDYTANLLLAGTLGRGAWTLSNPFGENDAQDGQQGNLSPGTSSGGASASTLTWDPRILTALCATMAQEGQGLAGADARLAFSGGNTGVGEGGLNASSLALAGSTAAGSLTPSSVQSQVSSPSDSTASTHAQVIDSYFRHLGNHTRNNSTLGEMELGPLDGAAGES
jgi:hypothetical protein